MGRDGIAQIRAPDLIAEHGRCLHFHPAKGDHMVFGETQLKTVG
jgi:hypothetical protein